MINDANVRRARVLVRGAVQGVGFRPFIYRLAADLNLAGWVNNSAQGVVIEVEGDPTRLESFLHRVQQDKPPHALIQAVEVERLAPAGYVTFEIRHSDADGSKTALILPDLGICPDCLRELFDPADRRYRYPFINCTNCGPRFSIIEALPYDRPNTTMKGFALCPACRAEYENPLDRRFHAQPNACPVCGPHLELWDGSGVTLATHDDALVQAAEAIRQGQIVAVKGLGGFHLIVDARNDESVRLLRARKGREEKPFALMFPALESVRAVCDVSEAEAALLTAPEAPIVLLRRSRPGLKSGAEDERPAGLIAQKSGGPEFLSRGLQSLASSLAPGNPNLGVMLPYTPLHHLLMAELGFPVVATSGNRSDEPICTDEREALERLAGIADLFLMHNRPIARHVDDSVARVLLGDVQLIRRARGYAPLPVEIPSHPRPFPHAAGKGAENSGAGEIVALGAHLKNAVAVSNRNHIFISQHIGDLDTPQADDAFRRVSADLQRLYDLHPAAVACDLHPDYRSTQAAESMGLPVVRVQHHHAHVLACLAENGLSGPALGVSWDGTGYGTDGTIWGGEFLRVDDGGFTRAAHLRTFRLPGGDQAVKEPRRSALGVLYEIWGDGPFTSPLSVGGEGVEAGYVGAVLGVARNELAILRTMLSKGLNAPITSSAGRLFDAVAALIGLRQRVAFEGQAAMELEFALDGVDTDAHYDFALTPLSPRPQGEGAGVRATTPLVLDWEPAIRAVLDDVRCGVSVGEIAARFHNTLVEMIIAVARRVGEPVVALTGGCFQNRYLTERTVRRLQAEGFHPVWHRRVPPNDGGIALGQAVAALQIRGE